MEKIPDEVMLMIFDQLLPRELIGSVARVCKRWASLVTQRAVVVARVEELARVHRGTRALRLGARIVPFADFLHLTPPTAPHLRDLTVHATSPFTVEHFPALNHLPHLEHLDIFLKDRLVDLQLIPYIVSLKSLVINETVSTRVFRALAAGRRLHALHMYGRSLYYPRRELLVLLRARRFHLREITLRCTELHDASYAAIGLCEQLTSLQLYGCWLMTGTGALHLTRLRKLRRLHVTGARMLRSRSLASFVDRLPSLIEELNLSVTWFGDEHIAPLIHQLPKLRVLELWKCHITTQGLFILVESLTNLTLLDLDITLTKRMISDLETHPSLLFLRCLTERSGKDDLSLLPEERNVQHVVTKKIKVVPTDARYPCKYFRSGSSLEGYRASLYYYWTQDVELEPLPNGAIPDFDEDDDLDWYF